MQTVRSPEVFPFLAEGVRRPGKAAHGHADGKVLTLNVRSANAAGVQEVGARWDHAAPRYVYAYVAVSLSDMRYYDPRPRRFQIISRSSGGRPMPSTIYVALSIQSFK
jgi:hypothetical protein